jgi:IS1 family transposase
MGIEPIDNNGNREKEDNLTIHIASKSETCLIEAINGRIRNYLARFNRKTKRYSKSFQILYYSLLLFFDRFYWRLVLKNF